MFRKADLCTASGSLLEITNDDKNNQNERVQYRANVQQVNNNPAVNFFQQPAIATQPQVSPDKVTGRVFNK